MNDVRPRVRRPIRLVSSLFLLLAGCGTNPGSTPTAQELLQSQSNAVEAISVRGAIVEKTYPPGKGYKVDLSGVTITDEDLKALKGVGTVAELNLHGATITDEQLAKIVSGEYKLSHLFKLDISDTPITDAGLHAAKDLDFLAHVNVKGSKVTEAGIKELTQARTAKPMPFGLKFKIEK